MHCRIFKSKSKQKIIERIEVKETTMNTKPKRSGTNRYFLILKSSFLARDHVATSCDVWLNHGFQFYFIFMFTSFPRRVTPTLPEVKAKFFSKNSPKNSTEKANLITLLHYMFQLLNCRAPIIYIALFSK